MVFHVNAMKKHVLSLLLHKFNHNATKLTKMFGHLFFCLIAITVIADAYTLYAFL